MEGLANSTFGQALITGALHLPEDTLLPGGEHSGPQPHVFGADEAFPHPQRPHEVHFKSQAPSNGKGSSTTGRQCEVDS